MLDPEERYNLWDSYKEKLDKLFIEVDDDLIYRFSPRKVEPDKDTPTVKKFRDILEKLYDFIDAHHKELYSELLDDENERYNLRMNFEAWETGICPKVLRKMTIYERYNNPELQEFFKNFSQKDHERAFLLWREKHGIQLYSKDFQASA